MPNNNRKGPNGNGPKTGRGLGKCGNNSQENESNFGKRNGKGCQNGRRNGGGRGCRNENGRGYRNQQQD